MHSGDTCLVHGGTYHEGNLTLPSGSPGSPTVLQGAPGETVIIQPGGGTCIICFNGGQSWITIDHVVLDGSDGSGNKSVTFDVLDNDNGGASGTTHLTVQNSDIKNSHYSCFLTGGSQWTIANNHIHDCGTDTQLDHGVYFQTSNSLVTGNTFDHNACFDLQNYSSHGVNTDGNTYTNNVFTNSGCGVVVAQGNGVTFAHNLIYANVTRGGDSPALICCGSGDTITDNTIVDNSGGGIGNYGGGGSGSGTTISGNIVCDNSGGGLDGSGAAMSGNMTSCPQFANASSGDFHVVGGDTAGVYADGVTAVGQGAGTANGGLGGLGGGGTTSKPPPYTPPTTADVQTAVDIAVQTAIQQHTANTPPPKPLAVSPAPPMSTPTPPSQTWLQAWRTNTGSAKSQQAPAQSATPWLQSWR
jgi:hypothetical protein